MKVYYLCRNVKSQKQLQHSETASSRELDDFTFYLNALKKNNNMLYKDFSIVENIEYIYYDDKCDYSIYFEIIMRKYLDKETSFACTEETFNKYLDATKIIVNKNLNVQPDDIVITEGADLLLLPLFVDCKVVIRNLMFDKYYASYLPYIEKIVKVITTKNCYIFFEDIKSYRQFNEYIMTEYNSNANFRSFYIDPCIDKIYLLELFDLIKCYIKNRYLFINSKQKSELMAVEETEKTKNVSGTKNSEQIYDNKTKYLKDMKRNDKKANKMNLLKSIKLFKYCEDELIKNNKMVCVACDFEYLYLLENFIRKYSLNIKIFIFQSYDQYSSNHSVQLYKTLSHFQSEYTTNIHFVYQKHEVVIALIKSCAYIGDSYLQYANLFLCRVLRPSVGLSTSSKLSPRKITKIICSLENENVKLKFKHVASTEEYVQTFMHLIGYKCRFEHDEVDSSYVNSKLDTKVFDMIIEYRKLLSNKGEEAIRSLNEGRNTELSVNVEYLQQLNFAISSRKPFMVLYEKEKSQKIRRNKDVVDIDESNLDLIEIKKEGKMLLDYDGTLVGDYKIPTEAYPRKELLDFLIENQKRIVICTGRGQETVNEWFPVGIEVYAEFGALHRDRKGMWELMNDATKQKPEAIKDIIEYYHNKLEKSIIEEKTCGFAFHYENCNQLNIKMLIKNLLRDLRNFQNVNKSFDIKVAKKVIEISQSSKLYVAQTIKPVLVAGDTYIDEIMYAAAPRDAITIKVGKGATSAKYRIKTPETLLYVLKHCLKRQKTYIE